ncbi:MAG TPA: DUF5131 family protein [Gemmatimonadales bacterium]|jgi:protein gp37
MAEGSAIAWTHNTFNPWIGCVKVSDGCKHCYAETLVTGRMGRPGLWGPASAGKKRARTSASNWKKPLAWNRAAQKAGAATRVFCASLADVFEEHPDLEAVRPELWALIRATPYLWWQLLTKRPENLARMLPSDWGKGYPNVWLGTSIEDMRVAHRTRPLIDVPATVRFISYEPAIGPLDDLDLLGIDWVIYGGESGPGYRPEDKAWARSMKQKCDARKIAFFHKQSAALRTEMGITLDGKLVRDYPAPRAIGQLDPAVRQAYRTRIAMDREMSAAHATANALDVYQQWDSR